MSRIGWILRLGLVVSVAVGCADAARQDSSGASTVRPAAVLNAPTTIPPGGDPTSLHLAPPPPDYVPSIPADQAVQVALGSVPSTTGPIGIQPTLTLLTDPNYRPVTPNGDPIGPPFWVDKSVWMVTIDGVCWGAEGGGFQPVSGSPKPVQQCPNHEVIVFVDASTGEYLMDISYR
jgi:hypothetical protein